MTPCPSENFTDFGRATCREVIISKPWAACIERLTDGSQRKNYQPPHESGSKYHALSQLVKIIMKFFAERASVEKRLKTE
jgi:hypothetical protein